MTKKYAVINKTPHPVNICDTEGNVIRVYERDETPIRLKQSVVPDQALPDGTPTSRTVFGDPVGLPEYRAGVFYIVSQLVKSALPSRRDLLVPSEVVRDAAGNIIGCKSLGR